MTSFRTMQSKDFHYLRAALIIILFWYGIWNLTDISVDYIHEKTNVEKCHIFAAISLLVIGIILIDPYVFDKI